MEPLAFDHPMNIVHGAGRIIYVEQHQSWVLPGGAHTKSKDVAQEIAARINDLTDAYWSRRKFPKAKQKTGAK